MAVFSVRGGISVGALMAPRYIRSSHRRESLLRCYRRLMSAGLAATWVIAVALQPRHGPAVGSAASWTHVAALAPLCWLWLTHPKLAIKLLFAALAGSLVAVAVAGRAHRPRYH